MEAGMIPPKECGRRPVSLISRPALQSLEDPGWLEDASMSIAELLPKLQALPRAERLQLIQLLIVDLAREEGVPLVELGAAYPVWSPHQAYGAAAAMLKVLDE
jgi:hypothetical protein